MVVEQKVTSMTTLKIKSYLLGPILNNFQRGLGKKILPFHFLNLHHEFGNSFFSKFWHINQKKFMKQKRQQIDHRVAWRRPFLWFQLHFWDIVAGATHRRSRSNPPKVCLPPLVEEIHFRIIQIIYYLYLNFLFLVWCYMSTQKNYFYLGLPIYKYSLFLS